MQTYGNMAGESGVIGYEIHAESIEIQFAAGWVYEYTYTTAGVANVERMKELARSGQGLTSFVSRNAANAFASKTRAPMIARNLW